MFDNLVESTSDKGDLSRKGGFFAGTMVIYATIITAILIGSIVWYDSNLESDTLELLTELDTPIQTLAPEPEPEPDQPKSTPTTTTQEVATRTVLQYDTNTPVPPKETSTQAVTTKSIPPGVPVRLGSSDTDVSRSAGPVGPPGPGTGSVGPPGPPVVAPGAPPPPPPPPPKATPTPEPKKVIKSGGVLNGKATSLPKPTFPANAKAVRASGVVSVQVVVDETGRVISANAVSGHPLLRAAAVTAARNARFAPTLLSGQAVKVNGIINFNFTLE